MGLCSAACRVWVRGRNVQSGASGMIIDCVQTKYGSRFFGVEKVSLFFTCLTGLPESFWCPFTVCDYEFGRSSCRERPLTCKEDR